MTKSLRTILRHITSHKFFFFVVGLWLGVYTLRRNIKISYNFDFTVIYSSFFLSFVFIECVTNKLWLCFSKTCYLSCHTRTEIPSYDSLSWSQSTSYLFTSRVSPPCRSSCSLRTLFTSFLWIDALLFFHPPFFFTVLLFFFFFFPLVWLSTLVNFVSVLRQYVWGDGRCGNLPVGRRVDSGSVRRKAVPR